MALILPVRGIHPQFGTNCFLAENATVVGEVIMGDDCTVWFNAVIRGDVHFIHIGNRTNIQDGAVIHGTYQRHPTVIGSNVSIAHNAIVHGCTVQDNVLVGMGAILMDGCVIGEGSLIAAGSVVLQNTMVEPGSIFAGNPAKLLRPATPEHTRMIRTIAENYPVYAKWFRES
jgi:gamma-carbonic anhydrase